MANQDSIGRCCLGSCLRLRGRSANSRMIVRPGLAGAAWHVGTSAWPGTEARVAFGSEAPLPLRAGGVQQIPGLAAYTVTAVAIGGGVTALAPSFVTSIVGFGLPAAASSAGDGD